MAPPPDRSGELAPLLPSLTSAQVVALTAYHEAQARRERGRWIANPPEAMHDVVEVVVNRSEDPRWAGLSLGDVCLAPKQFSCWRPSGGADNFGRLLRNAEWLIQGEIGELDARLLAALAIATQAVAGQLGVRILDGATHYYAPASMLPRDRVPDWVEGAVLTTERYGHKFYRGVR